MKREELQEEIGIEIENIRITIQELNAIYRDVGKMAPTVRDKTAAAAFLAQFYNGIENVLKRITRFHGIPLPTGDTWHVDLFRRFCVPPMHPLPLLFDESLASELAAYRKFRHVVHHGYGFQLEWERMDEGIRHVDDIFMRFQERLEAYMRNLQSTTAS
ncbi:MAG TPA: hypothetical protein VJZ49_05650 [Syntrophales bacterium]|nr:hypothetical protein [Syntrophales bacterium]